MPEEARIKLLWAQASLHRHGTWVRFNCHYKALQLVHQAWKDEPGRSPYGCAHWGIMAWGQVRGRGPNA
eukprot:1485944-Karenia_brevis.AAC.1